MTDQNTISIHTGDILLAIQRDGVPTGETLVFNPSDLIFIEKFYKLFDELKTKLTEFNTRSEQLTANNAVDPNGIPLNAPQIIEMNKEANAYMRARIDDLFGKGVSQKLFGSSITMDVFEQFFQGIIPYVQKDRQQKVAKYTNTAVRPRKGRK